MSTATKAPRAIQKNAELTFLGVITLVANIMPTKRSASGDPETKLVCPVLDTATPLKQYYMVEDKPELGKWTVAECHRALSVDDKLVKISTDALNALKEPTLPAGECDFKVFPLTDVLDNTLQSGTTYLVSPTKMSEGSRAQQSYSMLIDLTEDAERQGLTFVGELTVKGVQRMYRVIVRNGNLLLQELVRPDEILPPVEFPSGYDGALLETAAKLMASQVAEFNPAEYGNEVKARARQLAADIADGKEPDVPAVATEKSTEDTDDLLALLTASVEAAAPEKPARKRAAKK